MMNVTWKDRLSYAFDNTLARGPMALVGWLGLLSAAFVLVLAMLAQLVGANPDFGFAETLWTIMLQALAPNPVDLSAGPPLFLGFMFVVTLGGIFLVSLFIGVLTNDLDSRVQELRKGRTRVIEEGHTVVLGWSEQIFSIVAQLAIAHQNRRNSCIVILADRDKVEMQDEIRHKVGPTGHTRVVCRSGNPIEAASLELVSLNSTRSIIVLAPDAEDPDANVIKTVLAITNNPRRRPEPYQIVAEIRDPRNMEVARLVGHDETEFILIGDLIARIVAQTCRQAGLSAVYTELLNFEGDEIYFHREPALAGSSFGEALTAYEKCSVIGLVPRDARPVLNPPTDTTLTADDQLIVIAQDAESIRLSDSQKGRFEPAAIVPPPAAAPATERTLILGWNWRAPIIISQLDPYVAPGSTVTVVSRYGEAGDAIAHCCSELRNQTVSFLQADTTDRGVLDDLAIPSYNHVILLCYSDMLEREEADAHTLITLLHLRDIADRSGHSFSIVSEMLDIRNRTLAEVTRADDFIVSDNLISLMLAQVSENKELNAVFAELFDPAGSEIYLRPAGEYVTLGKAVDFYTVLEAARQRHEIAIGYRLYSRPSEGSRLPDIIVNPPKSTPVVFEQNDRIIVLAED